MTKKYSIVNEELRIWGPQAVETDEGRYMMIGRKNFEKKKKYAMNSWGKSEDQSGIGASLRSGIADMKLWPAARGAIV